jgi:Zn finger protein HypA/HybF involved in hydrogenase expression
MGPLSEVDPTRLMEAFSKLSSETVAQQATLDIEALPLRMRCGECGCQLARVLAEGVCPECGQDRPVLENADGLELKLVEFAEAQRERREGGAPPAIDAD